MTLFDPPPSATFVRNGKAADALRHWRGLRHRYLPKIALGLACACIPALATGSSGLKSPADVDHGVRVFMQNVARDVTEGGPLAWRRYFDLRPSFFMAVNGQMAFASGAAAQDGTAKVAQTLEHIELKWSGDMRVDPLTNQLAVVAVPWSEVQVDAAGHHVDESGFLTAVVEYKDGNWRFRDLHWSAPMPRAR